MGDVLPTIRSISENTNGGADFYLQLGDFLDAFYRAGNEERVVMLADAPEDMPLPEFVPFLASAAHKLANDYKLIVPRWVFDRRCYLPGGKPHFGCNAKGNLRLVFMYVSPSEFKRRNLFVDENVLVRV